MRPWVSNEPLYLQPLNYARLFLSFKYLVVFEQLYHRYCVNLWSPPNRFYFQQLKTINFTHLYQIQNRSAQKKKKTFADKQPNIQTKSRQYDSNLKQLSLKMLQWTLVIVNSVLSPILFTNERCSLYSMQFML